MKNFSLLIKPASANCNLLCEYCFYLEKNKLYSESSQRMSDKTLDRLISSYMTTPQGQYTFGWQGGEPTLMGVDFFRRVTALQEKYGKRGATVSNGLQTNCTLIDDEFAEHLAKYNFLLGVSLDGPEDIHNKYRRTRGGEGSYNAVLKGIDALKRHNVEFNILSLVTSNSAGRISEIYKYYQENDYNFLQFIPCVEFDPRGKMLPYSIDGKQWGEFLCELFDLWHKTDTRKVSIRLFDSILIYLVDNVKNLCHLGNDCRQYFVVEHNGDIYPCDFFVKPELKLGNIMEDNWEDLQKSEKYKEFGLQKSKWNPDCSKCQFVKICAGDCLKHRLYGNINEPRNLSVLCEGWKIFFDYSLPKFKQLAKSIKRMRQKEKFLYELKNNPAILNRIGRNDQCPCGSGKKFKACCMKTLKP